MYQWELTSFIDNGAFYDVVVTTNDPFNVIDSISWRINGLDEEGNYVNYYDGTLTSETNEMMLIYSGSIAKPAEPHYELELSMNKYINQNYYTEIIHTLSV